MKYPKCPSVNCTFGSTVIKHQWQGLYIINDLINKASFSFKTLILYKPIVMGISYDSGLVSVYLIMNMDNWNVAMVNNLIGGQQMDNIVMDGEHQCHSLSCRYLKLQ